MRAQSMTSGERRAASNGFTLLEVMVSVAVLALMMMIVWTATSQSMKVEKRVNTRSEIFHKGEIILRKLSDDIEVAFLAKILPPRQSQQTPISMSPQPAGPKTFFIARDRGSSDEVSFTSLSHMRLFNGAKESDQCKIGYEIVSSKDDVSKYSIIRKEDAWLNGTVDIEAEGMVLASGIKDFDLEYYDDRDDEWHKEWDTEKLDWKDRLPKAVKIRISFPDPYDERESIEMSTAVVLALSKGPIEM